MLGLTTVVFFLMAGAVSTTEHRRTGVPNTD